MQDANGDGIPDFLVTETNNNSLAVLHGNGDLTFTQEFEYQGGSSFYPEWVAAADLNHDGIPDLVATDVVSSMLYVFLGTGNGNFKSPVLYSMPHPEYAGFEDFDGAGNTDIVVAQDWYAPGTATFLMETDTVRSRKC